MVYRFVLLALLLTLGHSNKSLANYVLKDIDASQPLGKFVSYKLDTNLTITIDKILNQKKSLEFNVSNKDYPSLGMSSSTAWIRLVIDNVEDVSKKVLLENRYTLVDRLTVYHIQRDGTYISKEAGDTLPIKNREIRYRNPTFALNLHPGVNTIYLRFQTAGSMIIALHLRNPIHFQDEVRGEYSLMGALIGFLIIMTLYYLVLSYWLKSLSFFLYGIYTFFSIFNLMALTGATLVWFPNAFGNWLSNQGFLMSVGFATILGCVFSMQFLSLKKHMKKWFTIFSIINLGAGLSVVGCLTLPYSSIVKPINMLSGVASLCLLAVGIHAMLRGFKPAKFYTISWLFELVAAIAISLRSEGLIPFNHLTEWGLAVGGVVKVFFVSIALIDRFKYFSEKAQGKINKLNEELKVHIEEVETIVEERTEHIRLIVDNVKSGFVTIDENCVVQPGFTKSCLALISPDLKENHVIQEFLDLTPHEHARFQMAVQQVFDDMLPEQAGLNQIPRKIQQDKRVLDLAGAVVRDQNNKVAQIIFTVNDVSELQEKEKEAKENLQLVRILNNMDSFKSFIKYSRKVLARFQREASQINDEAKHHIHTLKGNAMIFGLEKVSHAFHDLEAKEILDKNSLLEIEQLIKQYLHEKEHVLNVQWGNETEDFIIAKNDFDQLKEMYPNSSELQTWIDRVQAKTVSNLLGPIHEDIQRLAKKQGKSIDFTIAGSQTRIYTEGAENIVKNLVHLLRNSVIHGIEDNRSLVGKSMVGQLFLGFTTSETGEVNIICFDDGKGIPRQPRFRDLVSYFKSAGNHSTLKEVDMYSGRGMGVHAVISAVEELGGKINIESEKGKGTKFFISLMDQSDQAQEAI